MYQMDVVAAAPIVATPKKDCGMCKLCSAVTLRDVPINALIAYGADAKKWPNGLLAKWRTALVSDGDAVEDISEEKAHKKWLWRTEVYLRRWQSACKGKLQLKHPTVADAACVLVALDLGIIGTLLPEPDIVDLCNGGSKLQAPTAYDDALVLAWQSFMCTEIEAPAGQQQPCVESYPRWFMEFVLHLDNANSSKVSELWVERHLGRLQHMIQFPINGGVLLQFCQTQQQKEDEHDHAVHWGTIPDRYTMALRATVWCMNALVAVCKADLMWSEVCHRARGMPPVAHAVLSSAVVMTSHALATKTDLAKHIIRIDRRFVKVSKGWMP